MFSSLSSYIWGEETQNGQGQEFNPTLPDNVKASRDQSPDDWVLVGETASPAPSQSSSASSEAGDNEAVMVEAAPVPAAVVAVTPSRHRQASVSIASYQAKKELKCVKSAQLLKQKNTGKALTSKALNRSNKTFYNQKSKKHQFRQNLNLKMAGANKNLKQC